MTSQGGPLCVEPSRATLSGSLLVCQTDVGSDNNEGLGAKFRSLSWRRFAATTRKDQTQTQRMVFKVGLIKPKKVSFFILDFNRPLCTH